MTKWTMGFALAIGCILIPQPARGQRVGKKVFTLRSVVHNVTVSCAPDPGAGTCDVTLSAEPVVVAPGDQVNWTVSGSCALAPCPGLNPGPTDLCPGGAPGSFCIYVPGISFGPVSVAPTQTSPNTIAIPTMHPRAYGYSAASGVFMPTVVLGTIAFGPLPTYPFVDDFDDGVVSDRFTSINGAGVTEVNGKLRVTMTNIDSGLEIDLSDFPHHRCLQLPYEIAEHSFPVGATLAFETVADSYTIAGAEFSPVEIDLTRPFWNLCEYTICQDGNDVGAVGFTGSYTEAKECPKADCLTIDWMPDSVPLPGVGAHNGCEVALPTFMIELKNAAIPNDKTKSLRHQGKKYKSDPTGRTNFTHKNGMIKNVKIVKKGEKCNPGGSGNGSIGTLVIELNALMLDNVHRGTGQESLSINDYHFDRGEITTVSLTTDAPVMVPGVSTLTMGPEVFIHNFQVLSPTTATADIQIDLRARNSGHMVAVWTGDERLMTDFIILPIDPTVPDPPNIGPTLTISAPATVPPQTDFSVDLTFDDPDDQWIRARMVVMELPSQTELYDTEFFFVDTSGPDPVVMTFLVNGLPPGQYKVVSVPNDGLAPEYMVAAFLSVPGCTEVQLYGDIVPVPPDPAAGNVPGDGIVDLNDILCVLDDFAHPNICAGNGDVAPCSPNLIVDLDDILAVLDAFAGDYACPLPCLEGEPNCGLPTDTVNGGCNSTPPVFSPISCGQAYCGTAAFDGNRRDTDWFQIVVATNTEFTWTVTAEFDLFMGMIETTPLGTPDCATATVLDPFAVAGGCATASVTRCVPPGTYWWFVAPQFTDILACGAEYNAVLTCVGCSP